MKELSKNWTTPSLYISRYFLRRKFRLNEWCENKTNNWELYLSLKSYPRLAEPSKPKWEELFPNHCLSELYSLQSAGKKYYKLMENSAFGVWQNIWKEYWRSKEAITKPKPPTISGIELTTEQW